MMGSHDTLFAVENDEEFRTGSYNGVSIVYRVSDKYVNVGKLCQDSNKNLYNLRRGKRWNEILKYWLDEGVSEGCVNLRIPIIELKKGYNKAQGTYIHPDLIHFVADWISIEYAFKVSKIMNLINERNQIEHKSLNNTINLLQVTITNMKIELAEKDKTIERNTKHIIKTSVPVKNCEKKLHILVLQDNFIAGNEQVYTFKISADSTQRDSEIIRKHNAEYIDRKFIAPASMNLKQLFHNKFGYGYYFNEDRYNEVIRFMQSHNIKEVV